MRYYKVVSNKTCIAFYDNRLKKTLYTKDNIFSYRIKNGLKISCQYIADELLTASELKKYYGITQDNIANFPFLQPVDIPKNKIHWFFGARFQDENGVYFDKYGNKII